VIPVVIDLAYSSLRNHARAAELSSNMIESTVEYANGMKEAFEGVAADLREAETDVGVITWLVDTLLGTLFGKKAGRAIAVIGAVAIAVFIVPPLYRGLSRRLESGKKTDDEA
jgi:hypothetical protein